MLNVPEPMHIQASDERHSCIMKHRFDKIIFILLQLSVLGSVIFSNQTAFAQNATTGGNARNAPAASRPELIYQPKGNFSNNVARPLRYWPVGTDFVITNGAEFFNRPLYCLNSGFRIDGGDKPEFSLYLPGRGGN